MTHANLSALIGHDPELQHVLQAARIVARTDVTLLIQGECGSGKETLARRIHAWSPRADGPLEVLRCAGMAVGPTDVAAMQRLRLPVADGDHRGGTLLLDEPAELSAGEQGVLLAWLQGQEARATPAWRVIVTSARDSVAELDAGRLRPDLHHRLNVVPLQLPALREREADIPELAQHFLDQSAKVHGLTASHFSASALRLLRRHAWPGNLRELRNLCERLALLLPGRQLMPENLPLDLRSAGAPKGDRQDADHGFRLPETGIDLRELEIDVMRQALSLAAGNKSRAARLLGLTRDTFLYRLRKYLSD